MNALLLTGYMQLEMVEMPVPETGPDDVLVRVRACGICGSDVHGLDGRTGRRRGGARGLRSIPRSTADAASFAFGGSRTCATTARCWAFRLGHTGATGRSRNSWQCRGGSRSEE